VDVFTDRPFGGNPLAVCVEAPDLPADLMQAIAAEMNLSETTFVMPPSEVGSRDGCDWRVRIFTPRTELPMAGHPTLGTAFALRLEGRVPGDRVTFEEGVGPVPVRIEDRAEGPVRVEMQQPAPQFGPTFPDREALARILGLAPRDLHPEWPAQVVSCGVPFLMVPLAHLDAARRARPALADWSRVLEAHDAPDIMVFSLETESAERDVHARLFAPRLGVPEDPATGSAVGPLGAYLALRGAFGGGGRCALRVEQGIEMGRPSLLEVAVASPAAGGGDWSVAVAGRCVSLGEGVLEIPT